MSQYYLCMNDFQSEVRKKVEGKSHFRRTEVVICVRVEISHSKVQ